MTDMSWLEIAGVTLYSMIGVLSYVLFTLWLHEVKTHQLGASWIESSVIAASLALVWPLSLFMLYVHEKRMSAGAAADELDGCDEEIR